MRNNDPEIGPQSRDLWSYFFTETIKKCGELFSKPIYETYWKTYLVRAHLGQSFKNVSTTILKYVCNIAKFWLKMLFLIKSSQISNIFSILHIPRFENDIWYFLDFCPIVQAGALKSPIIVLSNIVKNYMT